jgi:hypothetical protein
MKNETLRNACYVLMSVTQSTKLSSIMLFSLEAGLPLFNNPLSHLVCNCWHRSR